VKMGSEVMDLRGWISEGGVGDGDCWGRVGY
jgi:hypothetical protein